MTTYFELFNRYYVRVFCEFLCVCLSFPFVAGDVFDGGSFCCPFYHEMSCMRSGT